MKLVLGFILISAVFAASASAQYAYQSGNDQEYLDKIDQKIKPKSEEKKKIEDELKSLKEMRKYKNLSNSFAVQQERGRIAGLYETYAANHESKAVRKYSNCVLKILKKADDYDFTHCLKKIKGEEGAIFDFLKNDVENIKMVNLHEKEIIDAAEKINKDDARLIEIKKEIEAETKKKNDVKSVCSAATPTVDLTKAGGPLEKAKVQNQASIGSCYANAASILYEAELGYPVSYLDLALTYKASEEGKNLIVHSGNPNLKEDPLEGGAIWATLGYAKKRGVCKREDSLIETRYGLGENDDPYEKGNIISMLARYIFYRDDLYDKERKVLTETLKIMQRTSGLPKGNYFEGVKKRIPEAECMSSYNNAVLGWKFLLDQLKTIDQSMGEIMSHVTDKSADMSDDELFQLLIASKCADPKNRVDVSMYDTKSLSTGSENFEKRDYRTKLRKDFTDVLSRGKPVAVSICSQILGDGFYDHSKLKDCAYHGVTVTGFRFNKEKNVCEFNLWNSWGKGSQTNWIDEQELFANLYGASYLEKKK